MTTTINNAVKRSDVYAIISAGWSDRLSKSSSSGSETQNQFSNRIFNVKSVPHDWLFTKIDAAVHHGGAGSTAASIRGADSFCLILNIHFIFYFYFSSTWLIIVMTF